MASARCDWLDQNDLAAAWGRVRRYGARRWYPSGAALAGRYSTESVRIGISFWPSIWSMHVAVNRNYKSDQVMWACAAVQVGPIERRACIFVSANPLGINWRWSLQRWRWPPWSWQVLLRVRTGWARTGGGDGRYYLAAFSRPLRPTRKIVAPLTDIVWTAGRRPSASQKLADLAGRTESDSAAADTLAAPRSRPANVHRTAGPRVRARAGRRRGSV